MSNFDLAEQANPPFVLENHYEMIKKISSSSHSVYHANDLTLQQDVALKIFILDKQINKHYCNERDILNHLDHPNIIKIVEAVDEAITTVFDEGEKRVSYLCYEFASNGDLYDIISQYGGMHEVLARTLFHSLVSAIEHIHSVGVAHLDLKLENLLFDKNFNLKVIDFDLSQPLSSKRLKAKGTPNYRAPEIQKGMCWDLKAADIYSLGIVLFILMSGNPPYVEVDRGFGPEFDLFYRYLRKNNKRFWDAHQKQCQSQIFSNEFKDLINLMLAEEPPKRANLEEVKQNKWYQGPVLNREDYQEYIKKYLERKIE